jgi:hypothetical protein
MFTQDDIDPSSGSEAEKMRMSSSAKRFGQKFKTACVVVNDDDGTLDDNYSLPRSDPGLALANVVRRDFLRRRIELHAMNRVVSTEAV